MQCKYCGADLSEYEDEICWGCSENYISIKSGDKFWWHNVEQKKYKPDYEYDRVREV